MAAAVAVAVGHADLAQAAPLTLGAFARLAARCGPSVAPSTLASLAQTESGLQPLSVNDNTTATSGVPTTRDAAIRIASALLASGHSVDIGLMQINSGNFASLGLTVEAAFDPCISIAAAATILVGDYAGGGSHAEQQAALRVALSRYNTGDARRGFANGYVRKVEWAARQIVPALDAALPGPAATGGPASQAAAGASEDPDAPPSWDVWSSLDYAATHRQETSAPAPPVPTARQAILAGAAEGPTPPDHLSGPVGR